MKMYFKKKSRQVCKLLNQYTWTQWIRSVQSPVLKTDFIGSSWLVHSFFFFLQFKYKSVFEWNTCELLEFNMNKDSTQFDLTN